MSWLLFLDESGHDLKESPYEVLAGVAIEDRDLWDFICEVQDEEIKYFGQRISVGNLELKAKKLLKRKTFRLAAQMPFLPPEERLRLAKQCLEKGERSKGKTDQQHVTKPELTALAQAKIAFVDQVLELCAKHRMRVIASAVDSLAPRTKGDFLRKDYAYLFERYHNFLEVLPSSQLGLVVFDELERSQCHLLVDQMTRYFRETAKGRMRAVRIIPEPFFVHSDLTTAIQVADLFAYLVAWGVRVGGMDKPKREELGGLADKVLQLRHCAYKEDGFKVWSIAVIDDLRPRDERK